MSEVLEARNVGQVEFFRPFEVEVLEIALVTYHENGEPVEQAAVKMPDENVAYYLLGEYHGVNIGDSVVVSTMRYPGGDGGEQRYVSRVETREHS